MISQRNSTLDILNNGSKSITPKPTSDLSQSQIWEYLGFNYASWWNGKFAASESTEALKQVAATGSDTATIVTTNYVANTQSSEIFALDQKTESLQNVEKAIVDAKNQGLSVWLKPHVDPQDGQWRGFLNPTDRTSFFDNYKAFMLDYAKLAQAQDVEVLVIGTEIDQLIGTADKDYWLDLIAEVRQVYDGKLTYAVNWDKAGEVSFAEGLDFVGIDAYYPLTENKNASVDDLVKAWTGTPETDAVKGLTNGQSIVDWLREISTDYGKPLVFTEIGFRSLDGTAAKPYEFNGGGQVDFEEQARLYEAFFKVFGGEAPEAGNLDWFKGAQFWNWYATETQNSDPTDLDYPILGKPAEDVFKEYSSKLLPGSPDPVDPVDPVDPMPGSNSAVDFAITNDWGSGYQGQVEITNKESTQIDGWTLEFEFAGKINQIWGAEIVSHTGDTYVVRNESYDGTVAPGQTVSFGFIGEGLVPNLSDVFELNGKVVGETPTTPTDPDPVTSTIAEIVAQSGGEFDSNSQDFDMLFKALEAAGLTDALADPAADLTVFAPTDAAFVKLAQDLGYDGNDEAKAFDAIVSALTELGNGDPIPVLQEVLKYHVSAGAKTLQEVKGANSISTLLDGTNITPKGNSLGDREPDLAEPKFVNGLTNVEASNGIVQGIDRVLIPLDLPGNDSTPTDPTPTPTQSGNEWLEINKTYTGTGTYYGATGAGNAGYDVVEMDQLGRITALNRKQWNNSEGSGAFFEVSGPYQREGKADPITVMVVDQLPDRDNGLDLSAEAFAQVADPISGVVELQYDLVSPADNFVTPYGNRIGDGIIVDRLTESNPYWPAVRLTNYRNPVEGVALVTEDGKTLPMERKSNNIFVLEQGIGEPLKGNQDFVTTDIFGQQVALNDLDITSGTGEDITTGQQFPMMV